MCLLTSPRKLRSPSQSSDHVHTDAAVPAAPATSKRTRWSSRCTKMVASWPQGPPSESVPASVSVNPVAASSVVASPTRRRMLPPVVRCARPRPAGGAVSVAGQSGALTPGPWTSAVSPMSAAGPCPAAPACPSTDATRSAAPRAGGARAMCLVGWLKAASKPRPSSLPRRNRASSPSPLSGHTTTRARNTRGIAASGTLLAPSTPAL
mmetsp:Transcript_69470/g.157024  ORF Transcript_69470/g.157024 Transcript_69470/m.157024 type:complete len:208 (-) Transcript_69470:101-724(-)